MDKRQQKAWNGERWKCFKNVYLSPGMLYWLKSPVSFLEKSAKLFNLWKRSQCSRVSVYTRLFEFILIVSVILSLQFRWTVNHRSRLYLSSCRRCSLACKTVSMSLTRKAKGNVSSEAPLTTAGPPCGATFTSSTPPHGSNTTSK